MMFEFGLKCGVGVRCGTRRGSPALVLARPFDNVRIGHNFYLKF